MARPLPRLIGVIHLPPLPGSPGASHLNPAVALSKAGLWAVKEALDHAVPGDTVLFSPAFASFGMFKNEYDRGDQFNEIVKQIP